MAEILASLDDINAKLPSQEGYEVVVADDENTNLLQISAARIVRGYFSRVIDNGTLVNWATPESTPELIREIAGTLIASALYYNQRAKSTANLPDNDYAQKLYNDAIAMMQLIITGDMLLPGVTFIGTGDMTLDDGFPIDSTDRAFTRSMVF